MKNVFESKFDNAPIENIVRLKEKFDNLFLDKFFHDFIIREFSMRRRNLTYKNDMTADAKIECMKQIDGLIDMFTGPGMVILSKIYEKRQEQLKNKK